MDRRDLSRTAHAVGCSFLAAVLALAAGGAEALVIKTWDGPGTRAGANDTAPDDDPGFHNTSFGESGVSKAGIYLGDQWVLTANHVGAGTISLPGGNYDMIPGTSITLTNPSSFNGQSLTSFSDLRMFRVKPHATTGLTPEEQDSAVIPNLVLADRTPNSSEELLMIGVGNRRTLNQSDPNGQTQFGSDWGFVQSSERRRVWGTNKLNHPSSVPGVVRSGNNLWINTGFNDQLGYVTRFDRGLNSAGQPISDGSLPDEAQGAAGDSGGPVFFKDDDQWVLSGVLTAVYLDNGQAGNVSLFGNHTAISDLSLDHYYNQIEALRAQPEYSLIGDLDLDGSITGEIINGEATGDLAALVDGWLMESASANVHTWMRGDLNQDGITDLADFALMRDALGGTISTSSFAALVGGAIPEPGTASLVCLALAALAGARRRRG